MDGRRVDSRTAEGMMEGTVQLFWTPVEPPMAQENATKNYCELIESLAVSSTAVF